MAGALAGIRVVDFGQYIAGPLVGVLLADQGADVVRVDPPDGPAWDAAANAFYQRGKRSIALDLHRASDAAIARELIASADVVVENFRPGVMERWGLGAEAMTSEFPGLVYCSLPGFAADDPRAGMPAWEGVIKAASGTYRRNREGEPPGAPVYTPLPIASTFAAEQAAIAIAMALTARERDGMGQRIVMPLFDAMFATIGYQGLRLHTPPERGAGGGGGAGGAGLGGTVRCKDGRWLYFRFAGNGNAREVMEAIGIGSWVSEGLLDAGRLTPVAERREEAQRRFAELMASRDAEEWEAIVSAAGGEAAVCRETAEWVRHAGALAGGIVMEGDDPILGRVRMPGVGVWMAGTEAGTPAMRSVVDGDRAGVLADLPEAGERVVRQAHHAREGDGGEVRAVLDGVRVLDLCIVLAGPTCGRVLAEYGAEVIKIEAPDRPPSAMFHLDVNRGKRSIVLDLKQPEGQEVFWTLLESADVVVQNFRNGVAERLGVGYEQVRARKPDVVYASLNMYGREGPLAGRPGHEQFAQAATGMQARYGGDGSPQLQRLAVTDYGTGYLGAYAVAAALLHRARTGEGQHVGTSLAHGATMMQAPFAIDHAGAMWDEPRGQDAIGDGPLHRAYAASDGWFFFGARRSELARLSEVVGVRDLDALEGEALVSALRERFMQGTADEWVSRLGSAGFGVSPYVHDIAALMDEPWVQSHGLSVTREVPGRGVVTHPGPGVRLSRTPVGAGRATQEVGDANLEVLEEAGLGARASEFAGAMRGRGGEAEAG